MKRELGSLPGIGSFRHARCDLAYAGPALRSSFPMSGKVVSRDRVVHPRGARQVLKQAHRVMPATVRTVVRSAGAKTGRRDLRTCVTLIRSLPGVNEHFSGQNLLSLYRAQCSRDLLRDQKTRILCHDRPYCKYVREACLARGSLKALL
jgi:hypothetical protein